MKRKFFLSVVVLFSVTLFGCLSGKNYPRFTQVLTYDRAYDYTYLKTLDALNTFPKWTIEETNKEQGLIVMRNTEYGHIFDKDKQTVRFFVTRLGRTQTSIEIDSSTQHVPKGGEFLKRIDRMMLHSGAAQKEQFTESRI